MPRAVTVHTAAALTGRSPRAIRRLLDDGVLPTIGGGLWRRIPLHALEAFRGSRVTPVEYMAAQASLEKTRSHWRAHSEARRKSQEQVSASGSIA